MAEKDELFLIDTHTHIDGEEFYDDFEQMLSRAKEAGLGRIIVPAIEPNRFDRLRKLTEENDILYQGIGIHPHSSDKFDNEVASRIKDEVRRDKVIAIGEIGLEYHYDFVDKATQHQVFDWHLDLAADTGLPALIHSREAEKVCIDMFKKARVRNTGKELSGVLHCFSETPDIMHEAVEAGLMVSFTGNITFKKFGNLATVEEVPLDKFMIETDAPYMAPVPHRGKRNEPALVGEVAKKIAEIKNMDLRDIVKISTENAMKFFKLTVLLLVGIAAVNSSYAIDRYDGYEDEDETDWSTSKSFGLGFHIGSNTIIDELTFISQDGDQASSSRSADGLLAYGLTFNYFFNKYLMGEISYTRSVNNSVAENFANIDPYEYDIFLANLHWTINPDNPIKFVVNGGVGNINTLEFYPDANDVNNILAFERSDFLIGAAFGITYDLELPGATVAISPSWRVYSILTDLFGNFFIRDEGSLDFYTDVPFTRLLSIPQLQITVYPEIF